MIDISNNQFEARDTLYNRSLCCNKDSLERLATLRDTAIGAYVDFVEEISSIHLFPFEIGYIPPTFEDGSPASYSFLTTTKNPIAAVELYDFYEINPAARYLNFNQFYVQPKFNNFADYKGYTVIRAFLPFVGYVDIDPNECMGKWLQFRLLVDYFTGKGLFIVGVSSDEITHSDNRYSTELEDRPMRVISTFECSVGIEIPIGSSNFAEIQRNLILGTIKVAAGFATSVATMSAAPAITTTTSTVEPTVKTYDIKTRGTQKGARLKTTKSGSIVTEGGSKNTTTVHHKSVNSAHAISNAVDSSIDTLNRLSPDNKSDRCNDANLMWSVGSNVHVDIYRPKFVPLDANYGSLYGYPLGDTYELGNLSGYTEINAIHIEGEGFETITNKEVALLEEVFANGIIL